MIILSSRAYTNAICQAYCDRPKECDRNISERKFRYIRFVSEDAP